ncbi:GntR family transcriptional regulator [Bifidobacterium choloepi]|uniref:GntR family transcriptional regulator n=1 Tax=Bifidobacterium choloepi TaxID=2614131 RepID=A0A6I5NDC0_9BIFI|nr:GntR family transcriptional regulator [Bifidobacterium choloepi]NEG70540.1 GntR family transcriptional regulator [Bifidobacterium choloepi]
MATETGARSAAAARAVHDIHVLADVDGLGIGSRLPSERELAERLHVSRSTVRLALDIMRAHGEIVTRAGRAGTVIASDIAHHAAPSRIDINAKSARIIDRRTASTSGIPHMLASQGMDCATTVIDAAVRECPPEICRAFQVPALQQLICVERVRSVDGQPFSHERTYLHPHDYPDFLECDLTQSIYQTLQFQYGTVLRAVDETIEMVPAFGSIARQLRVPSGTPLLAACSRATDTLGHTVVVSIDAYVAAQVRLTTSRTLE